LAFLACSLLVSVAKVADASRLVEILGRYDYPLAPWSPRISTRKINVNRFKELDSASAKRSSSPWTDAQSCYEGAGLPVSANFSEFDPCGHPKLQKVSYLHPYLRSYLSTLRHLISPASSYVVKVRLCMFREKRRVDRESVRTVHPPLLPFHSVPLL
jgi:hypothetical protein